MVGSSIKTGVIVSLAQLGWGEGEGEPRRYVPRNADTAGELRSSVEG
jgi:hypothetical protein